MARDVLMAWKGMFEERVMMEMGGGCFRMGLVGDTVVG